MAAWHCPYCQQKATLLSVNVDSSYFTFKVGEQEYTLRSTTTRCPNDECGKYTLKTSLWTSHLEYQKRAYDKKINEWGLVPQSLARPFPGYVPAPIIQDYEEACSIETKSPKASATLSRRCLQGMIRDFWGISKARLIDEINELENQVDGDTWAAIDGVRRIGNIGAHMEKDINVIVDVDPGEARLLIELVETLIEDWYVARHEKQKRLLKVTAAAAAKAAKKQA